MANRKAATARRTIKGDKFMPLVVVGSSAGGIEALSALVRTLPAEFPAPIVIAQHLDPRRVSHLGEILTRHSTLPVARVEQEEPLKPGTVYVVPANRHVEITDHAIRLQEGSPSGSKPSIDLLLSSAAEKFGEDVVAVILTGTGQDGAAGANNVKRAGGTVIIQNPRTASYPALPLSLAPTTVDIVANVEDIGPLLHSLLTGGPDPAVPEEAVALESLLAQLHERQGIDFTNYKRQTILRRLQRRMAAVRSTSIQDYIRYIETHPIEYQQLISSFLIKVTEFFRDSELFEYLSKDVLPEVIEGSRRRGGELRLWSAGCATGEEAYSLAILVCETLGEEPGRFHVRIFGTDLDGQAIEYARRGLYPDSALTNLPPHLVEKYFNEVDGQYQVNKQIRSMTIFGQHDLAERAPFPRIELLMCRNVLIYFATELQRHVLQLAAFSLVDGGYLVLGKAETISPLPEYFVADNARLKVFRRRGDRPLMPQIRFKDAARLLPDRVPPIDQSVHDMQYSQSRARPPATRSKSESVLLQLPFGIAVVDRHYDIQSINAAARQLLGIHGSAIGEDLVHLAQDLPSKALQAVIDAAFRHEPDTRLAEVPLAGPGGQEDRYLEITCYSLADETEPGPDETVAVCVTDVTREVATRRDLEQRISAQSSELEAVRKQVNGLLESNRRLLDANRELTDTNLEVRSANEEFLVGNEELQAATEEVETLNEEMQATNEELETLNEELQATVEELNATNDDLQARSIELQDLAISLEEERRVSETERAWLEAILVSIGDGVLVVDASGEILLTNASYDAMFGAHELAPLDEGGRPLPAEESPRARAARGESFTMEFALATDDGSRRWFEAHGRPVQNGKKESGGVVIIRDITERSMSRLQDEFLSIASHELRTPLTAVKGYLGMIVRRGSDDADDRPLRYANLALDQVRRLETLINDLHDVTRMQSGHLVLRRETLDLTAQVGRAVELAQGLADGHTIDFEAPEGPLHAKADAGRLEQILLNLLTNAFVHAPDSDRIIIRLRNSGHDAVIEVEDHGPGIPQDELPNIFSRFYAATSRERSPQEGLGLGLFITKQLVDAHGGSIEVRSTEGERSTFIVRLPLERTQPRR